jgi:hypothetical protein
VEARTPIARIAGTVTIGVRLPQFAYRGSADRRRTLGRDLRIGHQRAVIHIVRESVAIDVVIAGIADVIAIHIRLIRVGHTRTVVTPVRATVAIGINAIIKSGAHVAGVSVPFPVAVLLARIEVRRAVVHVVRHTVSVAVWIARVTEPIPVLVRLPGVVDARAVVAPIWPTVAIGVHGIIESEAHVAGLTHAVTVTVLLHRVRDKRTVVRGVRHSVPVGIVVAGVSDTVAVGVRLVGVGNARAVVACIRNAVTVGIEVVIRSRTSVANIADAVAVVVRLIGIVHVGTVIPAVRVAVVVVIHVTDIARPVAVGIFLAKVTYPCGRPRSHRTVGIRKAENRPARRAASQLRPVRHLRAIILLVGDAVPVHVSDASGRVAGQTFAAVADFRTIAVVAVVAVDGDTHARPALTQIVRRANVTVVAGVGVRRAAARPSHALIVRTRVAIVAQRIIRDMFTTRYACGAGIHGACNPVIASTGRRADRTYPKPDGANLSYMQPYPELLSCNGRRRKMNSKPTSPNCTTRNFELCALRK